MQLLSLGGFSLFGTCRMSEDGDGVRIIYLSASIKNCSWRSLRALRSRGGQAPGLLVYPSRLFPASCRR